MPRPRKALLARLALCALATSAQALAPAGASALTSTGTSNPCYLLPGSKTNGLTTSGKPCTKIEGGSAPTLNWPTFGHELIEPTGKAPTQPEQSTQLSICRTCLPDLRDRGRRSPDETPGFGGTRGAGPGAKEKKPNGKSPPGKEVNRGEVCRGLSRDLRKVAYKHRGVVGEIMYRFGLTFEQYLEADIRRRVDGPEEDALTVVLQNRRFFLPASEVPPDFWSDHEKLVGEAQYVTQMLRRQKCKVPVLTEKDVFPDSPPTE